MAVKLSNNATSTLSAAISANATALTIQANDVALFPALGGGDWFPATLVSATGAMEIVRVTARDGATMTIQRGQEGTTAKAFPVGSKIDLRLTTAALLDLTTLIQAKLIEVLGFTPVQQGGTAQSGGNKIYLGWGYDGSLKLKIDNTEFGSTWPIKAVGNVDKAGDTITGALTVNGNISTQSVVKVGVGQEASVIEMHDTNEGTRSLHNNSGTIGFLSSTGSWIFKVDDKGNAQAIGNFTASGNVFSGKAYLQPDGNVAGSVWSNWGSNDAYNAILTRIEQRALDWANNRISAMQYRLVSEGLNGQGDTVAPWGACVMGMKIVSGGGVEYYRYRYMQIYDPVRGWVAFYNAG